MQTYKRGNKWYVAFMQGRQRRRLSLGLPSNATKRDAERAAPDVIRKAALEEPKRAERQGTAYSLSAALERTWRDRWSLSKSGRTSSSLRYRVNRLQREIGHWLIEEVTYARLKDFADGLRRDGVAPATINRRMSAISTALRDCVRRGELAAMPEMPHYAEDNVRERYLTNDEERALFAELHRREALGESDYNYLRDLVAVLIDTGMRLSEALGLGAENVVRNVEGPTAVHLKHGTTKSDRGRVIPLTQRAALAISGLLASPLHGHLTPSQAGQRFRTVCASAGIEGVTLHTLRHTCASRLVQRGVDLYTVSKWLGHSSVKVTERYAHLAPDALLGALAVLETARYETPDIGNPARLGTQPGRPPVARFPSTEATPGTEAFHPRTESGTLGTQDYLNSLIVMGNVGAKGETRSP